jgi:uroporphyrinogen-III synthase
MNNGQTCALAGKMVVVTRSVDSADELIKLLEHHGAIPWLMPLIKTAWVSDLNPADQAIKDLEQYQGILFSSANGAEYFFERARQIYSHFIDQNGGNQKNGHLDPLLNRLKDKKIVAVGPKTASRLKAYGLDHVIIPKVYRQEGLVELLIHLFPSGGRLLYPRAKEVRPYLMEELRKKGYDVNDIILYQTEYVDQVDDRYWQAILTGQVDAVTFSSASTVKAFDRLFTRSAEPHKDKRKLPVLACIGPVTAKEAENRGYTVEVVAKEHTVSGLVQAMEEYFSSPGQRGGQ